MALRKPEDRRKFWSDRRCGDRRCADRRALLRWVAWQTTTGEIVVRASDRYDYVVYHGPERREFVTFVLES